MFIELKLILINYLYNIESIIANTDNTCIISIQLFTHLAGSSKYWS